MSDSDTRDQKAGGVSTMPRPAAPPRRTARPRPPAEPGRRPGLPDGVRLAPSAPSTTSAPSTSRGAARGGHRMPFILMPCVLLGGAQLGAAAMALAAAAALGSVLPARRAARLDPMIALRDE